MVKCAFTGSFDPPHEGHKYVVDFAKKLGFDVVVFVANNPTKKYSKSLEDRLHDAYYFFNCSCIASDSDNIGNIIKDAGCSVILRGLRNSDDFNYEQTVSDFNRTVNGLETFYVPCPEHLRKISSTEIRRQAMMARFRDCLVNTYGVKFD